MKDLFQAIVFGGLFLIPLLPVYVESDFFFPFITGKNFAFRIIVEVVFASWIILALYDKRYRPRFSWILAGFASLLGVMLVANALGEYPLKSFWSNFERMDGYITLVHIFMYVVVAGSVLTTNKLWSYFLHLSVAVALFVALYGLAQHQGLIEGGRARVDSRLGNAAYMAVYMLFHIFIVFWLFIQSKVTVHRIIYVLVGLAFVYTLLLTGTRGTFLGFIGGTGVMVGYVALFGAKYPQLRKIAIGSVMAVVLLVSGFFAIKDTDFIQSQGPLKRLANISLQEDLEVRMTIWSMALEGVKERPLFGWGQGNFNYVFNEQYDPSLYDAESWFDRTHNIFFDWLIAGGILGLVAYLSILLAALYYLLYLPIFKGDESFSVLERGVLLGLLVGYSMHNLVVFDNIISYIFYGTVLALIHARVSMPFGKLNEAEVDTRITNQMVVPVIVIVTAVSVYFLNVPGIRAAGDIIDAMIAPTVTERLAEFDQALSRNSFGDQEIVEQLAQQAMSIARNQNVPEEDRQTFIERSEQELLRIVEEKPGDARLHAFLSNFYRSIGALPQAQEQAAIARSLSPQKQAIINEQGVIELQMNNIEAARDYFKTSYELAPENELPRVLYAATLFQTDEPERAKELITDEYIDEFASNDYAVGVVQSSGDMAFLAELFEARITERPNNPQNRASLAYVYYQMGDMQRAIEVLQTAAQDIPEFGETAQCFIDNIEAGNTPEEGC